MKLMRVLLFVIIVSAPGGYLNAQKDDQARKIKSIVVYQEKHDMLVTRKYKDTEQYFDSRGNLIEDIIYKQGKVKKHFKYQYDPDGNKTREEELDSSGRVVETSEYVYVNGLRSEKTVYDSNKKIKSKKVYQYTTY